MATAEQVALVRSYTGESSADVWSDAALGSLIDEMGVDSATARVWREKQARYSRLVDVSEAGASRKMSQAFAHARAMADHWEELSGAGSTAPGRSARVHKIVRQ